MTDKELLELAAKAAGIHIDKSETNGGGIGNTGFDMMGNAVLDWHNGTKWNPLTRDTDAVRLSAKLAINIRHMSFLSAEAHYVTGDIAECEALSSVKANGDPEAAIRRAIVEAAVVFYIAKARYEEEARAAASIGAKEGDTHAD